jgi:hypothetical protein
MNVKTTAEILNAVFTGDALDTVYKTDSEVLNLVYDPDANALKVNIEGFSGGGGTGESIIDGEVSTYAELPPASEHAGEIYIVSTTTGIPLINRKQAGMYRSDGASWTLLDVDLQADKVYYSGALTAANVADAIDELAGGLDSKFEAVTTGAGTLFLADDGVYKAVEGGGGIVPDITTTEFDAGYKRGGKQVYGVEVDVGALPNTANKKAVIPDYDASYVYWFASGSYARNTTTTATIPLPYQSLNPVFIWKRMDNLIAINTSSDMSAYGETKIILNYTKD